MVVIYRFNKLHRSAVGFLMAASLLLQGCGAFSLPASDTSDAPNEPLPAVDVATLGLSEDCTYEYVRQVPSIITDRIGYLPSSKKVIYIDHPDLSRQYCIINADTEEVIFEGELHRLSDDKNGNSGHSFYIGDFSEFNTEGDYRIYQPDVGYSYEFRIGRDSYHHIYEESYKAITQAEYIQTSALIYTLSNLMLTREIYTNAYCNDAFITGGIELLLSQQHPRTGAVYSELQTPDTLALIEQELNSPANATIQTDSMISLSATAELAGVLAQYYCDYFDTDQATAVAALKAAGKAYNYIDRYRDSIPSDSLYFAASELYRATGQYRYKKAIADYDLIPVEDRTCSDYDHTMLADVAYLSSGYKTEYIRCEKLMTGYREIAAEISKSSTKQSFYVQNDIKDLSEDDILNNMMTLGLVSYVLSGHEYASIQANYLHYLFGINGEKTNYYTNSMNGEKPLNTDIVRLSKLIFILGNGE